MRWTWARLPTLAALDVHALLLLRARVFVVEQQCVFQDPDELDALSWHLLGREEEAPEPARGSAIHSATHAVTHAATHSAIHAATHSPTASASRAASPLRAYLRVVDPGAKYAEPAISRVITAPEVRGIGLGRTLFGEGLGRCLATWPGRGVRISAQAHLERFYAGFDFIRVGEPYGEDNIPHIEMWRAP